MDPPRYGMRIPSFRVWLEDLQLREPFQPGPQAPEMPFDNFDMEDFTEYLARKELRGSRPAYPFINEVQWGGGPGAIRVRVNTKWHVLIERQVAGMDGVNRWVLRNLFRVNTAEYRRREEVAADAVFEAVQEIDRSAVDVPSRERPDLVHLAERITKAIKRKCGDMFFYESARQHGRDDVAVRFSLVGGGKGLVAHGSNQFSSVEAAEVRVLWDRDAGMLRVMHSNIVVEGEGGDWAIQPASFDAMFAPSQRDNEISEAVVTSLKFF